MLNPEFPWVSMCFLLIILNVERILIREFLSKSIRIYLKQEWEHLLSKSVYFSCQLPYTRCSFTTLRIRTLILRGSILTIVDLDPRLSITLSVIIWLITLYEWLWKTTSVVPSNFWFPHPQKAFRPSFGTRSFKMSPEFDSWSHLNDFQFRMARCSAVLW